MGRCSAGHHDAVGARDRVRREVCLDRSWDRRGDGSVRRGGGCLLGGCGRTWRLELQVAPEAGDCVVGHRGGVVVRCRIWSRHCGGSVGDGCPFGRWSMWSV